MRLQELLNRVQEVQRKSGASETFLCGGMPRDKYLKRLDNIDDLDFCTGDESVQILSRQLARNLGREFNVKRKVMPDGHSSIFLGGLKLDFSSNFMVPDIDQHLHALNLTPTNMLREMYSRDFTCNALLLNLDLNKISAPVNGSLLDLNSKVIKTCLAPHVTLTTSKNRVVRAIYLSSKLDFDIDQSIIDFVKENPQSVKISSEHALKEKLNQAFNKDPQRAYNNLTAMNLWNYVPITKSMQPYYSKYVRESEGTNNA